KHFVRVIDATAKDDIAPIGPITLDVEDPFNDTPCMKAFIGNGVEQGHRHSMVYSMATLSKWTSIPKERAQEAIKEALEKSKADNARIDSEMKNVESLYTNEKRKFSCKTLREEFEGFCDKEHCPVWKGITPKKKGKKGKNGKEEDTKEEKEKLSFRSHLEKEGRLYLEVFTKDQEFKFAFLNDAGEIELIDRIETEPYPTVPVKLPMRNGEYMRVVKMPDDDILTAPLLSPEELLKEIEGHIRKYCDMNELDIKMVTYYVLFTWFYEKVNTCGVLRFLADTGKGKSRMNTVTGDLSFYPLSVAGSGSLSGAMRQNELWRGTMIMDEADFEKGKEGAWTKYINLGFEKGKYFALSDKQNPKYQEWFDPYSPKIIAMREPFRDNATEGRLISISPYETTSLDIPVILEDDYQKEAMTLRNKIAKFVILHWNDVDGKKMVDFKDLGLEPRLRQLAMPISIIFQLWEEGVEEFRNYLTKRQLEIKKVRALSWEGSVFNFVYSLASGEGDVGDEFEGCHDADGELLAVTPSMVAKAFNTTAKNVTDALRSIGFEVEHDNIVVSRRVGEEIKGKRKTIRKYVLPNENTWNEIVRRYYYNEDNGIEIPEIPEILEGKHYFIPFIQKKIDEKNVTYVTNVTDPHTEEKNEQPVLGNNLLDLQNSSSRFVEKSEANFLTYTKNPVCRSVTSVTSVTESQKNETDQPEDLLKNDPQVIGYENKLREIFNHSSDKNSFLNIAWHETGLDSGKLKKVWEELRGSFHYTDETEQTGDLSKKLIEIAKECGATASNGASAAEVIMKAVEKGIKKDEAIQVFHDLQISGLIRECALGRFVLEGSS
ncbi:MAG: hypothetical protein SVE93_00150, partial [Candidatus Thermoplasmatota archaeon]|nr:hypothetical protein [Candidatus Thermoplasmatota archaeon]